MVVILNECYLHKRHPSVVHDWMTQYTSVVITTKKTTTTVQFLFCLCEIRIQLNELHIWISKYMHDRCFFLIQHSNIGNRSGWMHELCFVQFIHICVYILKKCHRQISQNIQTRPYFSSQWRYFRNGTDAILFDQRGHCQAWK